MLKKKGTRMISRLTTILVPAAIRAAKNHNKPFKSRISRQNIVFNEQLTHSAEPQIRTFTAQARKIAANNVKVARNAKKPQETNKVVGAKNELKALEDQVAKLTKLVENLRVNIEQVSYHVRETGEWSLTFSKNEMIRHLEKQGRSPAEARIVFETIDKEVDATRRMLNLPFFSGVVAMAIILPLVGHLVYNKDFYEAVLEKFPELEENSWEWSEPLVSTALAAELGIGLAITCLYAMKVKPLTAMRDAHLVNKIIHQWGIPKRVAKSFIRKDS